MTIITKLTFLCHCCRTNLALSDIILWFFSSIFSDNLAFPDIFSRNKAHVIHSYFVCSANYLMFPMVAVGGFLGGRAAFGVGVWAIGRGVLGGRNFNRAGF